MELQHNLAKWIASYINDESDSEEEIALTTYGIELFMNEFLKVVLIFIVAMLVGQVKMAVIGTTYLFIARRLSGGRHFESNVVCTLFTLLTALVGPLIIFKVSIPTAMRIGIVIFEILMILAFVPYTKEGDVLGDRQRFIKKAASCLLYFLFLGIARLLELEGYINSILLIELIVLLATVNVRIGKINK